ncbi:MAG: hypothetical protein JXA20_07175 [Spirochaetes bacterium]|nr:hypothetical protein [Spirochaetota bacterium]
MQLCTETAVSLSTPAAGERILPLLAGTVEPSACFRGAGAVRALGAPHGLTVGRVILAFSGG